MTASSRAACCGAFEVVDRAPCGAKLDVASPFPRGQGADDADESVGVAEIEKRHFQFGERLDKAFEPVPRRASLGRRERPLKRRIRIDVAGPCIDIAHQETAKPRFDANRQPVAVLIVKHLVRLCCADPDCHGGSKERQLPPSTKYPEHVCARLFLSQPRLKRIRQPLLRRSLYTSQVWLIFVVKRQP